MQSLESIYKKQKLSASPSNLLQIPDVVVAHPERTTNGNIRSRMVVKLSDNMRNVTTSMFFVRTRSSYGVQPLIVSSQQIQNQVVRPFLDCCRVVSILCWGDLPLWWNTNPFWIDLVVSMTVHHANEFRWKNCRYHSWTSEIRTYAYNFDKMLV